MPKYVPAKQLHWKSIKALKEPGDYPDGGNLVLTITDKGVKRWKLRLSINGRRVWRGLGPCEQGTLEEVRDLAARARLAAKEGRDLITEERQKKIAAPAPDTNTPSFADTFDRFWSIKKAQLDNAKAAQQWPNTMRDYVLPHIGERPIDAIMPDEIISTMAPIWHEKPETASRVLQRINAVMDYAIVVRLREWNPCAGVKRVLGTQAQAVEHHPSLHWSDVPRFVKERLREGSARPMTRLCFEFAVLCAGRSKEAREATWDEIDMAGTVWTIPASRMKAKRPHEVPLSQRALEVLKRAKALAGEKDATKGSPLVFPAPGGRGALSDNVLSKLCRTAGEPCTPHGFRSSFRTWAAEHGVPREIAETCLAHIAGEVERAYQRGSLVEIRRPVMERWSRFVTTGEDPGPLSVSPALQKGAATR